MSNTGTATYQAEKLLKTVQILEGFIIQFSTTLASEWKQWEVASDKEWELIQSSGVEVNARTLVDNAYEKHSNARFVDFAEENSFLRFKWVSLTTMRTYAPLTGYSLTRAVLDEVNSQLPKGQFLVEGHPVTFGGSSSTIPNLCRTRQYYLYPAYHYGGLTLLVEETIPSPQEDRNTYKAATKTLAELRQLASLPDTELVTLSPEQVVQLSLVFDMVECLVEV